LLCSLEYLSFLMFVMLSRIFVIPAQAGTYSENTTTRQKYAPA
jgi:hypothetical protein